MKGRLLRAAEGGGPPHEALCYYHGLRSSGALPEDTDTDNYHHSLRQETFFFWVNVSVAKYNTIQYNTIHNNTEYNNFTETPTQGKENQNLGTKSFDRHTHKEALIISIICMYIQVHVHLNLLVHVCTYNTSTLPSESELISYISTCTICIICTIHTSIRR